MRDSSLLASFIDQRIDAQLLGPASSTWSVVFLVWLKSEYSLTNMPRSLASNSYTASRGEPRVLDLSVSLCHGFGRGEGGGLVLG